MKTNTKNNSPVIARHEAIQDSYSFFFSHSSPSPFVPSLFTEERAKRIIGSGLLHSTRNDNSYSSSLLKPHKLKPKAYGFTFVELLVTLSIIATISIVAYVSYASHTKIAYNATRIEAIDSLHLSLSDYYQQKKVLPLPASNYVAYDERGTYSHSLTGAYGVSGHVSNDFLPAGYVNFDATDPESHQFYGYGKTVNPADPTDDAIRNNRELSMVERVKMGKNIPPAFESSFDVASVLYDDKTGGYKAYVRGTYGKERLASLVRSYSSSDFVSQDSTENLPYNPYERKITAHLSSLSGSVTLTDSKGSLIALVTRTGSSSIPSNEPLSFTGELSSGDSLLLSTGSIALVHISDGSEVSLGSTGSTTELKLDSLAYADDNNLVSKVVLLLKSGDLWAEAPHLRTTEVNTSSIPNSNTASNSDFSVQTDSAVAAVRGTVFGVSKNPVSGRTSLSLQSGNVEVNRKTASSIVPFSGGDGFITTSTGFVLQTPFGGGTKSYMILNDGDTPIQLSGIGGATSTGTIAPEEVNSHIYHPYFSLGYRPIPEKISFTGATVNTGIITVEFKNYGADSYELYYGTGIIDPREPLPMPDPNGYMTGVLSAKSGLMTITGAFLHTPGVHNQTVFGLKACSLGKCSAPYILGMNNDFITRDDFQVWGEKKGTIKETLTPCFKSFREFCDEPGLVAYAPYENNVSMYDSGGVIGGTSSGYINESTFKQYNSGSGVFDDIPAGGLFQFNYGDGSVYDAVGLIERPINGLDIYRWGRAGTGIFLDNNNGSGSNDKLRYDLTSLTLTGSFSIEMSVRGAALKRPTGSYFLFDGTGAIGDGFQLSLYFGNLSLGKHINGCAGVSCRYQTISSGLLSGLDDNVFYKVKAMYDSVNGPKINIITNKSIISSSPTITPPPIVYPKIDSFYTGNRYHNGLGTNVEQWNDTIDSVKIYQY